MSTIVNKRVLKGEPAIIPAGARLVELSISSENNLIVSYEEPVCGEQVSDAGPPPQDVMFFAGTHVLLNGTAHKLLTDVYVSHGQIVSRGPCEQVFGVSRPMGLAEAAGVWKPDWKPSTGTGAALADALGNEWAAEDRQRYAAMDPKRSPIEVAAEEVRRLQAEIDQIDAEYEAMRAEEKRLDGLPSLYPALKKAKEHLLALASGKEAA